tara:strand:- start:19926 stop:20864 length:939 start_codon:yes stop_codon:yes gene_type:complete
MNYSIIYGSNGQDGQILKNQLRTKKIPIINISREFIVIENIERKKLLNNYKSIKLLQNYPIGYIYYFSAISRSSQFKNNDSVINQLESNFIDFFNLIKILISANQYPKVFFASSSLVFENSELNIVDENTIRNPTSFYAKTKIMGEYFCDSLNENGIESYTGILFNHESIYRQKDFLFPKIINTALKAKNQDQTISLKMGDPNIKIDVGYAPEFVEIIQLLIDSGKPGTYIISTNTVITIKEIIEYIKKIFEIEENLVIEYDTNLLIRKRKDIMGKNSKLENAVMKKPKIFKKKLLEKLCQDYKNAEKNILI